MSINDIRAQTQLQTFATVCYDPARKKNYPSDVIRQLTMIVKTSVDDEVYQLWKRAIIDRIPLAQSNIDAYRDLAEEACAKYYALITTPSSVLLANPEKFIEPVIPPTPTFHFINLDTVSSIARNTLESVKKGFIDRDIVELSWSLYTNLFLLSETTKLLRGTEFEEELKKDNIDPEALMRPCRENAQLYECVQELMERIVKTSTKLLVLANLRV